MNPIQANFFKIPTEHQLSIISRAENSKLNLASVCKVWHHLIPPTWKDDLFRLPAECKIIIISQATNFNPKELSKIALVCKEWNDLQAVNSLWKPALDRCIEVYKNEIDTSETNHKEQIKTFAKTRLNDYKYTLDDCAIKINSDIQKFTVSQAKYFLDQIDHTLLLKKLMSAGHLELVAKLILCKPKFDANEIANAVFGSETQSQVDANFIFGLFIKLKYNISDLLKAVTSESVPPNFISNFTRANLLQGHCEGIKITDLIACGLILNHEESKNSKLSLLYEFFPFFSTLYANGQFQRVTKSTFAPSFSDERLKKHIRKAPLSEDELKEFILDLLTKANLNLNFLCPAKGKLLAGTVLSQLRQLGDSFPKGNAIQKAVAEFDQLGTTKP